MPTGKKIEKQNEERAEIEKLKYLFHKIDWAIVETRNGGEMVISSRKEAHELIDKIIIEVLSGK